MSVDAANQRLREQAEASVKDAHRALVAASVQRLRARRRAEGMCIDCGKNRPPTARHIRCRKCLKEIAERQLAATLRQSA